MPSPLPIYSTPLMLVLACSRTTTPEALPHHGWLCVEDAPQPGLSCPAPTVAINGGCELVPARLHGQCAAGFAFERVDGDSCGLDDQCVALQIVSSHTQVSAIDLQIAQSDLEKARSVCADSSSASTEIDQSISIVQRTIRLFPHPLVAAQLAQCEETAGHLTRALSAWRAALVLEPPQMAGQYDAARAVQSIDAVREQAKARISDLEGRVSRVRIQILGGLDSVRVALDQALYSPAALSSGVELDPGEHALAASAHGRRPWVLRVNLAAGQALLLEPVLPRSDARIRH